MSTMEPYTVQAEYSFQGENNDELRFKKGDIITVTQREDGGWWEGTLGEMTGWFPSNYVKEYKASLPLIETVRTPEEIKASRMVVLIDLLESEKAHVAEIRGLLENFLEPLQSSQIVNADEYAQLLGNFVEVVEAHEELLTSMENSNDRIGKLFLTKAPTMKCLHQAYCAAHPRAIVILDKYSEQLESYMERQGAASPGLLVLTTGLSKPFRRLDKYAAMLQELERHMESGHPDRGDTQRSISIYKDIASMCSATRRQKELELQVLSGPVRNWQGQDLSTLGDIVHMGSVAVGPDHRDRYFVLFPHTLLILSVSQRMSAFIYEGKLPLTGISVTRLEDTDTIKNAFEITGPLIERITAVCQGPSEANKWVELLSPDPVTTFKPKSNESLKNMSNSAVSSPMHPEIVLDKRGYCARTSMCFYDLGVPNYKITYPPRTYPSTASYTNLTNHYKALVKDGLMHRIIIKALLYPEFHRRFNTQNVRLRRHHRTTSLRRRRSICSSSEISQQDSQSNDVCDTSAGSSISFVKYSANENSSQSSFVDHGKGVMTDCTRHIFENLDKIRGEGNLKRVPVVRDSDGSFIFEHSIDCDIGSRDSLQYYTKPVKIVIDRRQTTAVNSVIHTSTEQLIIGNNSIDKEETLEVSKGSPSNESEISGYIERSVRADMACEDLVNLNDSIIVNGNKIDLSKKRPTIDERHSMPTLFVGNRFNCSSLTEVFIPTYRDRMDVKLADSSIIDSDQCDEINENRHSIMSTATHSSSIELAPVIPAPDKLSAEILYNSVGTSPIASPNGLSREKSSDYVIKPPSMFGVNKTLSRELRLNTTLLEEQTIQNELKRCPSSRMINSQGDPNDSHSKPSDKNNRNNMKKCGCCTESPCASQRSSDSGMAGSYTIQLSPETPIPSANSQYDQSEHILLQIQHRLNGLMQSPSSHSFGQFENIPFADESNHDSGQYGYNEESESEPNRDSAAVKNSFELSSSQDTVRRKSKCQSVEKSMEEDAENISSNNSNNDGNGTTNNDNGDTVGGTQSDDSNVYKTGLYAHWWKKEQLPKAVLNDILRMKLNRESNSMSGQSTDSRGSDKQSQSSQRKSPESGSNDINDQSIIINHHLSYNQYSNPQMSTIGTLNHKQMIESNLQHVQLREKTDPPAPGAETSSKANWSIINLRPAPPLRPTLINSNSSSGGSGAILANTKKLQPTYEEDALVLRVIEAYCVAYQNPTRNALHSGLENEDMTPTLKQIWVAVRQLQQDMNQIKIQVNEERLISVIG